MASKKTRLYPKTNSLAFSRTDCHTCQQVGETCDRQRPRCRVCLHTKRNCGGYIMDLKWKDHSLADDAKAQMSTNRTPVTVHDESLPSGAGVQSLRFVTTNLKRKRRGLPQNHAFEELTTKFDSSTRSNQKQRLKSAAAAAAASRATPIVPIHSPSPSPEHDLWSTTSDSVDEIADSSCDSTNSAQIDLYPWSPWLSFPESTFIDPPGLNGERPEDGVECLPPTTLGNHNYAIFFDDRAASPHLNESQLSTVLYNDHAHKWGALLDMYNQEFCVLPLTQDCLSNPFRIQKDSCEGSDFLLHAVLALASQHIAKKDRSTSLLATTLDHQATALTLFRQSLAHTSPFTLLDTILLLVNFEATQSASSTWSVHLNAALRILEGIGISKACQRSSRTRAQIAMLIWWDTTLSFISRKDLVFPLHYLQTLMQTEADDGWTYFQLNGCPADLLMFMARFAKLASIYVKAEPFGCFNNTPVQQLVDQVQSWNNPEDGTATDIGLTDVDPNSRRNRFHCIEAWRHAILLYARRVFTKRQSAQDIRSITHLARVILDHVKCIPEIEIVQKQTLLPVFLAAAEVEDPITRSWVRSYCDHWARTARYDMFGTTAELLDLIWADWLPQTRDVYWWGCKIGHNGAEAANESLITEILLG